MNLKRPSFRRGGSTGIGQLTSNRQMYAGGGNIGGGTIAGSNLGTRTGFQSIILQSSGLPYPDPPKSKYVNPFKIKGYPSSKGILEALKPTGLAKYPITTGVGATAAIGAIPAYLAYQNRPRTLAEKKVMQDYGPIDETFFQYDEYDADRKRARGVGEEISFTEALFKDPDTGLYPKIFGSTESRTKRAEIEKAKQEQDDFEMPRGGGADFAEIAETVIADKKEDTPIKTDDDTPKEPSFEDTYEAEKKKLEKLLGDDDDKGMAAIALSEAIGTPGTIADKAAVLNKSLLGIMQGKKKDRKDIAKLAYTATKEIEKAKIAAGKEGFSERQFKEMAKLRRIITDTTGAYSDAEKAEAAARYKNQTDVLKAIGGKSTAEKVMKPGDAREQIKRFKDGAKKLAKMDKNDPGYGAALNEYMAEIEFLSNYPELMPSIRRIDAIYANVLAANKKDGGRIGFANGTPMQESIQVSETVGQGQVPTAQTSQLSFEEIRNRLPKEITDDVVRLIAGSNEALQDFSYIRTQGDVDKFNMKYGVTLVLPQSTA
jgi:hypothetical protein